MRGDLNTFQVQAAPPPGGLGLGRAVETRASLARTGAATALYRSSRPHYTAPGSYNSGHPSADETPTQMVSQAVRDQRYEVTAHASEARDQFTTMGAGAFTLQRPSSSCVFQAGPHKGLSVSPVTTGSIKVAFAFIWFGESLFLFSPCVQKRAEKGDKNLVGAFHSCRSSKAAPTRSGAFA